MKKYISIGLAAAVSLGALAVSPAVAEYPDKPVEFIVPWPPGDMEDVLTRMIAEDFQAAYGQPAAVVNKPGGGGGPFPGAVEVAKAPADGSVIGSFVIGVPVVGPTIGIAELNPDPFDPVGIFLTYPFVIVTSKDAPYKTMQELAEYAKSNDVVLGHFGAVLTPTQVTLALAKNLGFSYASDAAYDALDCNTLASGDVDVMNTTIQLVLPCLDKIQVLAAVTEERISTAADAPTVKEVDPSLDISLWNGLFVRKDTPADVRAKIEAVARKTMESDRAKKFAEETGAQIYWKDAEASRAQIAKDIATIAEVQKILGN
ncbi:MAG: tripartite tricarboxylate transporter substrate binding protein [Notoacmeibacter sp.]|nr:tripartite tricarboxylate transporter substrate binding protein [Notoacmeibacter sp.]